MLDDNNLLFYRLLFYLYYGEKSNKESNIFVQQQI